MLNWRGKGASVHDEVSCSVLYIIFEIYISIEKLERLFVLQKYTNRERTCSRRSTRSPQYAKLYELPNRKTVRFPFDTCEGYEQD